jgi:SOS-response transcriptional repressor LexA
MEASRWRESVDNYAIREQHEWVATTIEVRKHTYALRVQGDSMEPKFPDGAILIVEPEEEPKNGSFVIVRQNGAEATFKQLILDGGVAYLKPLNPRYPILQMAEDAVICGVVKQVVMNV